MKRPLPSLFEAGSMISVGTELCLQHPRVLSPPLLLLGEAVAIAMPVA